MSMNFFWTETCERTRQVQCDEYTRQLERRLAKVVKCMIVIWGLRSNMEDFAYILQFSVESETMTFFHMVLRGPQGWRNVDINLLASFGRNDVIE